MSEPMTSVPVPAAMPRESLNDLIDRARVAMAVYSDDGDFYGSEIISDLINALGEKEREIGEKHQAFSIAHDQAMANGNAAQLAEARALAAEAALAGERERTVRDTLLHVRNLLAANQVPLGKDFEDVWNANARELYES